MGKNADFVKMWSKSGPRVDMVILWDGTKQHAMHKKYSIHTLSLLWTPSQESSLSLQRLSNVFKRVMHSYFPIYQEILYDN